ncbi:hypothetical protein HA402_011152 [Bradysia odoriphaga]|nr:hypothetical protein HA402_011152 [Bradysia odoriphaga]
MENPFWKLLRPSRWCLGHETAQQEKVESVAKTTVEKVRPAYSNKSLLDLNVACLEKIFCYLNYDDLLNVVLYDKHFKAIARKVFLHKYMDEYVVLSNTSSFHIDPMHRSSEMDRAIQLLNCFGDVITNLCISFKLENIEYLMDAVNRICGSNIRKLKLNHTDQERKKLLRHEHGTLGVNKLLKSINKNFPNLHELHLIYGYPTDVCPYWYDVDQMVIPSLTHFTIDGRFVFEHFKKFIGLNPSIENLCVKSQCSDFKWNIESDFVPWLDSALPQLKYLEMSVACYVPDQRFDHCQPVYLQHLKKFKSVGHIENMWKPNFYQFAGNELQELELNELNFLQKSFIDCILHFKQLRQITIQPIATFNEEKKIRLEKDINDAFTNDEPIKVKAQKELLCRPRLDLHRVQFQRNPRVAFNLDFIYNRTF